MNENNYQTQAVNISTELNPTKNSNNFLITLLSVLLLISVFIAGFFAYQTQNLVKKLQSINETPKSTTIATLAPDPTTDWEKYTDPTYKFEIKYPSGWTTTKNTVNKDSYTQVVDLVKTIDSAFYSPDGTHVLWIKYINNPNNLSLSQIIKSGALDKNYGTLSASFEGSEVKFTESNMGSYKMYYPDSNWPSGFGVKTAFILSSIDNSYVWINIEPYNNADLDSVFNQVLSTFKFTEPNAISSPPSVACTMEAKICPDGSSVGRSGPKCEFSPCPTPKP